MWSLVGFAIVACARSEGDGDTASTALDAEQATLVAALAANEDGSDEAWTSASGSEPFLVEGCGFGLIAQRVLERYDTNTNGELDTDELNAIADEFGDPGERLELLLSGYDTDDSGDLDAAERDLLVADIEARCETRRTRLLEAFDADGDGTLDEAEREAARLALRERFAGRHAARVGEFDRDADGRLGPLERRSAGASVRRRVADRREEITESFDADQNGELDENERAELAEHLRECVRGARPLAPVDEPAPDAGTP
jgi:Ca2+-binding EF-hand superfamily protein